jgi:diguanylate cyclase (GGDEF)-like protein
MSDIDLSTTYMLLFDVDNFKEYNDTYGHETGDAVLVKVAETLKNHFRSDDHVCRIGGDEFVVLMLNADKVRRNLLELNFMRISEELKNGPDGLPPIFVSAGVAHGSGSISAGDLFVQADKALYSSKDNGKKRCTFFEDM